jgi:type IV pilus assembly protein PilP
MKKKVRNNKIITISLVLLIIFSAGCKKKEVKAPPPVKKEPKVVTKTLSPIQNQQSSSQLSSNSAHQEVSEVIKDPFKPYVLETKHLSPLFGNEAGRGLLPIQSYEVSQFRVLGIITGLKENSALVVDPTGKAYVVKAGMEIGKNGGKIERITSKTIEIKEKYRNESGKIKNRTVSLTLPRKE